MRLLFPAALPTNVLDLATGTVLDPQHARQAYNIAEPTGWSFEPFVTIYPPTLTLGDEMPDSMFIHGVPGEQFEPASVPEAIADVAREPYSGDLPLTNNILEETPDVDPDADAFAWPDVTIPYRPNILDDGDAVVLNVVEELDPFDLPAPINGDGYHTQTAPTHDPLTAFNFADAAARPTLFDVTPIVEERWWADEELIGEAGLLGGAGPDVLDEAPGVLAFSNAFRLAA